MKIKILTVQCEPIPGDTDKNIETVTRLLEESGHESADLIVFPELWSVGWDCPNFNNYAEELFHSKSHYFLRQIAKKYNANIVGGSSILYKYGENHRNSSVILDRDGKLIAVYDKYHLFSHRGQSEGIYLEPGDTPVLVETDIGKIGISICYDIRFPELFRLYTFSGADFIVNMAAWPKNFISDYSTLVKARAIENQIYVISSCLTGRINNLFDFSGNSAVLDFKGNIIASLGEEQGVLSVLIDKEDMNQYRRQMPILKDTKPEYKLKETDKNEIPD